MKNDLKTISAFTIWFCSLMVFNYYTLINFGFLASLGISYMISILSAGVYSYLNTPKY
jgi:hypothetical protein